MNNTTINIAEYSYSFDEIRGVLSDKEGKKIYADVQELSKGEYSILVEGRSYHLFVVRSKSSSYATVNNFIFEINEETLRDKLSKQLLKDSGSKTAIMNMKAPMPGLITKIIKEEGSKINAGEGILIVEAMKMENEIKSTKSGIVKKIFVKEKQTVEKNDILFTIE
jgi:biotin carboxyl carrier protein